MKVLLFAAVIALVFLIAAIWTLAGFTLSMSEGE